MSSTPSTSGGRKRNASEYDFESPPTDSSIGSQSDSQFTTPAKKRLTFDFWDEDHENSSPLEATPLPVTIDELAVGYYPDASLNIRVSYKGDVRSTRKGKVFDFHGLDQSSEISFVAFDEASENVAALIELDRMYSVHGFSVKEASVDYPDGTGNLHAVSLNLSTKIVAIEEDNGVPEIKFSFLEIQDVSTCGVKSRVDVLGVLVKDWGLEPTRKGTSKRDISITDRSKKTIKVTLWGSHAEDFKEEDFSVIAIRRGTVEEYKGSKSISAGPGCRFWTKPIMEECVALESWFHDEMDKRNKK